MDNTLMQGVSGLMSAEQVITSRLNNVLKPTNLAITDILLLNLLMQAENYALLASEISERMYVQKSVTTHRVKNLERLGAVVRHPVASDKRRTMVVLTAKGRRAFEVADNIVKMELKRMAQHFPEGLLPSLVLLHEVAEELSEPQDN